MYKKILNLISSPDEDNFELARNLCKGAKLSLDELVTRRRDYEGQYLVIAAKKDLNHYLNFMDDFENNEYTDVTFTQLPKWKRNYYKIPTLTPNYLQLIDSDCRYLLNIINTDEIISLTLNNVTNVSKSCFDKINSMSNLKSLHLNRINSLNGIDFRKLSKIKELRTLSINTNLKDFNVKFLHLFEKLEVLTLNNVKINCNILNTFKMLTNLQYISVISNFENIDTAVICDIVKNNKNIKKISIITFNGNDIVETSFETRTRNYDIKFIHPKYCVI